jgi:hypothetical protein
MAKITSKEFKELFDNILFEFLGKIDYQTVLNNNKVRFFGYGERNPYPNNGSIPWQEETLKGAFLNNSEILKELTFNKEKYIQRKTTSHRDKENWEKAKTNTVNLLARKYPNHKQLPKSSVLAEANITENQFDILAQEFSGQHIERFFTALLTEKGNPKLNQEKGISDFHIKIYRTYAKIKGKKSLSNQTNNSEIELEEKSHPITYNCYHYSFSDHVVYPFQLTIFYKEQSSKKNALKDIYVEQQGFHDNKNTPKLIGWANEKEKKLYINLRSKNEYSDNSHRIDLIINSGKDPEFNDIMRGVLTSVSARETSNIMTTEVILVKNDLDINNLDIKRYLFWQRRNFWINPRPLHLDRLQVRDLSFDYFSDIIGFWRAWSFDRNSNIIETLFYIRKDFQLTRYLNFYKSSNYNIQKCTFNDSKGYKGT